MAKNKTFTVQFVDQGAVSPSKHSHTIPFSSSPKEIQKEAKTVIKRGAILPISFDEGLYSDVETLTAPLCVELLSERGIPACINRTQFIAMQVGDQIVIPAGSKVRFDSLRNQIVLLDGKKSSHPIPQGFVEVFSDTLYFTRDQSIRFTNCAGFVPVGSLFKVSAQLKQQQSDLQIKEVSKDLLTLMETPSIISIN